MMLNAALSAGDLTNLRSTTGTHVVKAYLSTIPLSTVATALVNEVSPPDAIFQITVDNTSAGWSNVRKGMTVKIGTSAGAADIGTYRVRKAPTATILYLAEMSNGDPGLLALSTTQRIVDNAFVTIVNDYNLWSVFPRIEFSGGTTAAFYKDYDVAYSTQNQTAIACPLLLGEHLVGFVNSGTGLLSGSWTRSIDAFDGTIVLSTAWFVDEVAAGTGATLNHDFSAGHHIVRCTVTLANGATVEGIRHVFAHNTTTEAPYEIEILSDQLEMTGRTMTVKLSVPSDYNDFVHGQMLIVWFDQSWNGSTISSASKKFVGFVQAASYRRIPGGSEVTLEITSATIMMKSISTFSQILSFSASPTEWHEAIAAIMHPDYFIFYLFYYHTTFLHLFDITLPNLQSYVKNSWGVSPGNIVDQIENSISNVNLRLGQDSHGNIWLTRDPVLLSTSGRNALVERMTITEDDLKELSFRKTIRVGTGRVDGGGFVASTGIPSALLSNASGKTFGLGSGRENFENQLVLDQTELNERTGHKFAQLNNPYPDVQLQFSRAYMVFEPAVGYWVRLTLGAAYWPTGSSVNVRAVVKSVTHQYLKNGAVQTSAVVEIETVGASGQTVPIYLGNDMEEEYLDDLNLPSYDDNGLLIPEFDPSFDWGFGDGSDYWGIPNDFTTENNAIDAGDPGEGIPEQVDVVTFGALSGNKAHYTADRTPSSPTWTQVGTSSEQFFQLIPEKDSRTGVFLLERNQLFYSADIANTDFASLVAIPSGDEPLMRMTSNGNLVIMNGGGTVSTYLWNGTSLSAGVSVGTNVGEAAMDVDDFNLGLIVIAVGQELHYNTQYSGGSFTQMTGLTGITGSVDITDVKIPYKKANGSFNNSLSSIEFYYSVLQAGLYRVTYNFNTNSVAVAAVELSPQIGGNPTGVYSYPDTASGTNSRGQAFETYAGNTRRMVGSFRNGSGTGIFYSDDAGATWTEWDSSRAVHDIRFIEPVRGGTGQEVIWIRGTNLEYTGDWFANVVNRATEAYTNPQVQRGVCAL